MADKKQAVGICDHCLGLIPQADWYTRSGKPRLHCSVDCKNAANSHAGEPVRYQKLIERVQRGEWINPATIRPPTPAEQAERARKGRLREVAEKRWRNPALTPAAREKLSRPRRHTGIIHRCYEKLRYCKVGELTEAEQQAWREFRRVERSQNRDIINRRRREWYRKRKTG